MRIVCFAALLVIQHAPLAQPTDMKRSAASFSQAEQENGQSRMCPGVHWAFDKSEGISQGRRVADHAFGDAFEPKGASQR
jgi:hypothetical protein